MSQDVPPFKHEEENKTSGVTALAGLPASLDPARALRLALALRRLSRGWTDGRVISALAMPNPAGGDCVDHLEPLAADQGLCGILQACQADSVMFRQYMVESTTYFRKGRFAEKRGFRIAYAAFALIRLRRVRVAWQGFACAVSSFFCIGMPHKHTILQKEGFRTYIKAMPGRNGLKNSPFDVQSWLSRAISVFFLSSGSCVSPWFFRKISSC
jgi:hypothetical protein